MKTYLLNVHSALVIHYLAIMIARITEEKMVNESELLLHNCYTVKKKLVTR